MIPIRAQIAALEQFSDHASAGVARMLRTFNNQPA